MLEKVELNRKEEIVLLRSQLLTLYGNVKDINVLKNFWKKVRKSNLEQEKVHGNRGSLGKGSKK